VWNGTGGLVYVDGALPAAAAHANLSHAVAHVWSGTGWASQMWTVASHDAGRRTLHWGRGGFQDARASSSGAEWYLENAFSLLDHENEFFFSPEAQVLYLWHNSTGPPPSDAQLVATNLQQLLVLNGTQEAPVVGVRVENVNFRDAAQTFLEPHAVPSCGTKLQGRKPGPPLTCV
jgi:hypothetical protein